LQAKAENEQLKTLTLPATCAVYLRLKMNDLLHVNRRNAKDRLLKMESPVNGIYDVAQRRPKNAKDFLKQTSSALWSALLSRPVQSTSNG
jgi:hypothetical protein